MAELARILKDVDANARLDEAGYAIIPFLNEDEVAQLREVFFKEHPDKLPGGLYATAHSADHSFRAKMSDTIEQAFTRARLDHFDEVKALGGTFMCKSPGDSVLQPHQDWNIVDEEQQASFNVWVPLVDVSEQNGTIQVWPGSHKKFKTFRSINIPDPFSKVKQELWEVLVPLNMKAGEALVYDHRLLHGSKENRSDEHRLVVVFGIIPQAADMYYYYKEGEAIKEYHCSPEFYMSGEPTKGPNGLELSRSLGFADAAITAEQIIPEPKEEATVAAPKPGFWSKISSLFK